MDMEMFCFIRLGGTRLSFSQGYTHKQQCHRCNDQDTNKTNILSSSDNQILAYTSLTFNEISNNEVCFSHDF
jgi:hypothetical protein